MANVSSESRRTKTLAVSNDFADMITALARAKGKSVEQYCDADATPRFVDDYRSLLSSKMEKVCPQKDK